MIFRKLYQPQKSQPKYRRLFFFSSVVVGLFLEYGPNVAAPIAPTSMRSVGVRGRRAVGYVGGDDVKMIVVASD